MKELRVHTIYARGENSKKYIFKIDLTFKLCKILLNILTQFTKEARILKKYIYVYVKILLLNFYTFHSNISNLESI